MSKYNEEAIIKVENVTELTGVLGNIDINYVKTYIIIAQDAKIKPILGIELYNKLLADFKTDSLDDAYKEIYDLYVTKMASYFTAHFLYKLHNFKASNNGILIASPENFETLTVDDIFKIADAWLMAAVSIQNEFEKNIHSYNIPEYPRKSSDNKGDSFFQTNIFF